MMFSDPNKGRDRRASMAAAEAKSNTHKEAERRRRKRINAHIATLKSILPTGIKTDKASLLGEAVRTLKELKKKATVVVDEEEDEETTNEVRVVCCCNDDNRLLVKATLCCQDRPELVVDLIRALNAHRPTNKVVRAEMFTTVHGRTNISVWVNYHNIINPGLLVDTLRGDLKSLATSAH